MCTCSWVRVCTSVFARVFVNLYYKCIAWHFARTIDIRIAFVCFDCFWWLPSIFSTSHCRYHCCYCDCDCYCQCLLATWICRWLRCMIHLMIFMHSIINTHMHHALHFYDEFCSRSHFWHNIITKITWKNWYQLNRLQSQ